MSYPSVDALQKTLTTSVFHYAQDPKKAAGRALGTLVEIITFYTLRSWGLRDAIAIERSIAEFGNPDITHNVEYSLHPILDCRQVLIEQPTLPLTGSKLRKSVWRDVRCASREDKNGVLLTANKILRNSCVLAESPDGIDVTHLESYSERECTISVSRLHPHPFAIFECKRVGVEEGMKKGPQTIEKAKQGAYVARTTSSLQKIRLNDGRRGGVIVQADGTLVCKPYDELLREVIDSSDAALLKHFILSVGIVSNHGNWFTAENHNKELKVLAQSYDWLLFLTDNGLSDFISDLLLTPKPELEPARNAFLASYSGVSGKNRFTKVQMDLEADAILQNYFTRHKKRIESWFNILTPRGGSLDLLRSELSTLQNKNWRQILSL